MYLPSPDQPAPHVGSGHSCKWMRKDKQLLPTKGLLTFCHVSFVVTSTSKFAPMALVGPHDGAA